MKIIFKYLVSFLLAFQLYGQEPVLNFTADVFNKSIVLDWEVVQGNTCFGLYIQRSTDGLNFEVVGIIPGFCGSTSETISYTYTDVSPEKNKINYYRISLGNVLHSYIIQIDYIDLSEGNYKVKPNPITTEGELFFSNPSSKSMELKIYNKSGVLERSIILNTDSFKILSIDFDKGVHFFFLYEDGVAKVKGRFLII